MPANPTAITIPLINPNEPEALLVSLAVTEGQYVAAGQALCTLETTKSTQELTAEMDGYVVGLRLAQGQTVQAGEVLCYVSLDPAWQPPESLTAPEETVKSQASLPAGLRITQPALSLAQVHNLDLQRLPVGPLVTESVLRTYLPQPTTPPTFDPTAIIIYGGGGHGKSLIDLLRLLNVHRLVGIIDDGLPPGGSILGVPVLGGSAALPDLYADGIHLAVNAVGGIGDLAVRVKVFDVLAQAGFTCPAVLHPNAHIEPSAVLSPGVQVFAQAYVGSSARVGFGTIINTGAIISHDCLLAEYVNISPGAILAGEVQIDSGALVGMGVTINLRAHIGAKARIGNGATVKADVPEKGMVRAGTIWPA